MTLGKESGASLALSLGYFEGTLDILLYLVQRKEVAAAQILLKEIFSQFRDKWAEVKGTKLDLAAEFLGAISFLTWIKSHYLLPNETTEAPVSAHPDVSFAADFAHFAEYAQVKELAKTLSSLEEEQAKSRFRPAAAG